MFSKKQIYKILFIFAYCSTNSLSLKIRSFWSYEFVSFGANSSDESIIKLDFHLNRIERGVYTLSGSVDIRIDLQINDKTTVEVLVYRSANGSPNYKLTPFAVKHMDIFDFMNTIYRELLMESLHKCSNAPYFETKFQPPVPRTNYKLNNCTITNESFPSYVPEGYYKFVVVGSGILSYVMEFKTKVEHT